MRAYDCDGQELSVGDDVIYVRNEFGFPDQKIGTIYRIVGFDFEERKYGGSYPGLIFNFHPYNYGRMTVFSIRSTAFKKIDYSKKLNVLESDQIQYKPTQQFQ